MSETATHRITGCGAAAAEARRLLRILENATAARLDCPVLLDDRSAADDWASSGAMALTGWRGRQPLLAPGAPASVIRAATALLGAFARRPEKLPGVELLGERAAAMGLIRNAPWSAGGNYRSLRTRDGWIGMTLSRPWDFRVLPALLEDDAVAEPWETVAAWAARHSSAEAVTRAWLLDLACAVIPSRPQDPPSAPFRVLTFSSPRPARNPPVVVDLTSLWAGPLCAHLLGLCGGRVIKVESSRRPDRGRWLTPGLFDLLHGGHESVALDFRCPEDVKKLYALVRSADMVLESSRPRALAQLGIDAAEIARAGAIWVSISAYGRDDEANRVGFGDDVAASVGLVATDASRDAPAPCGDAIADPLSGAVAALAAFCASRSGGDCIVDIAMSHVAAWAAGSPADERLSQAAERPRCRQAWAPAARLGADTQRLMAELT